jgi:hypothetical protein
MGETLTGVQSLDPPCPLKKGGSEVASTGLCLNWTVPDALFAAGQLWLWGQS